MRKPSIGRSESEILRFVAERGDATVTEVGEHLAATKGQTRNTALNTMERLRQKGYLRREKAEGVYRYCPSDAKGKLLQRFVEEFVDGFLGGSTSPLVAYLGHRAEVDEAQLEELRRLVESLEARRGDV